MHSYNTALEESQQELQDIKNSFTKYMNGKEYVWEEELRKEAFWYKENVTDKLENCV